MKSKFIVDKDSRLRLYYLSSSWSVIIVDNEVEVHCRQKIVDYAYIICRQVGPLSLGAPPVLLM
jgi:hypothetical protein